jgi:putative membrane protein
MKNKLFVLALVSLGASSTALAQHGEEPHKHPQTTQQPATKPPATPGPATAALAEPDRNIIKKVQYAELYTIEISKIASEKVTDARVKQFAANVMADHRATLQALNKLATDRGMNTKMMSPKQKGRLGQFNRSATNQLAGEYLTQIVKRLENSIRNMNLLARAKDPTLAQYASSRVPILTAQLKKAQNLKNTVRPAAQG